MQYSDLEKAILDPASTFESPKCLMQTCQLSGSLKVRILQTWRFDLHRQLTNSDRDVPEMSEFKTLQEINESLRKLAE